jgi:NTE family protein
MVGFTSQGIDFGKADTIIGTSAGAIVGAQLALKLDLAAPPKIAPSPSPDFGKLADVGAAMVRAMQSTDPEPIRAEIGELALNAHTIGEDASILRFEPFTGQSWPNQFRTTTVNARTGRLRVWDASSGAPLERAIAASAAAPGFWPPITINGERYLDGGIRSPLNADLAIGSDIVIIVSCFALREVSDFAFFAALNSTMRGELDAVRRSGAKLAIVEPDPDFIALTKQGTAMMDINLVSEAHRLGHKKAVSEAAAIRSVWDPI